MKTEVELFGFNSTLVRLKLNTFLNETCHCGEFQFHTGSIKAETAQPPETRRQSFNSTLVRLKLKIKK